MGELVLFWVELQEYPRKTRLRLATGFVGKNFGSWTAELERVG